MSTRQSAVVGTKGAAGFFAVAMMAQAAFGAAGTPPAEPPRVVESTKAPVLEVSVEQLLPPVAMAKPFTPQMHPLYETFNDFLENQLAFVEGFEPTGLTKEDYLRLINGVVLAMKPFQHLEAGELYGEIVDPWFRPGQYRHYGTPHYAFCVALLNTTGYNTDPDVLASGILAYEASVNRMVLGRRLGNDPRGLQPWTSGDFYTYHMMRALPMFKGVVPDEQYNAWVEGLGKVVPKNMYSEQFVHNNWSVLNGCGEFMRAAVGMTDMDWTERTLALHRTGISANGTFAAEPFTYDVFPRYYLSGILQAGYRGDHFDFYRDRMWRGAWVTLFLQTPPGQLVTGSRSAHHCWNEAQMCKLLELYATAYQRAGREREAAIFKRAARLALETMAFWLNDDGSFNVVKHRLGPEQPTGPGAGHAYELYTQHTCYGLQAAAMLGMAWLLADDSIPEQPAPPDVGGFLFRIDENYRNWFAGAAGTYVQYRFLGDGYYDPAGVQRIHFRGSHPIFAPSDGIGRRFGDGQSVFSVGPGWRTPAGMDRNIADLRTDPAVEVLARSPEHTAFTTEYRLSGTTSVPSGAGRVSGLLEGGQIENGAVRFDLDRGYLQTTQGLPVGQGDFFFSLRFKAPARLREVQTLFAVHQEDNLLGHLIICEVQPNGRLRLLFRVPPGTTGGVNLMADAPQVLDGQWHHLAVGRREGRLQIWLNGERVAEEAVGATVGNPMTILFGRLLQNRPDRQWMGELKELRYYGGPLLPGHIRTLAEGGTLGGVTEVIDWDLDQVEPAPPMIIREQIDIRPGSVELVNSFEGETEINRFFFPYITFDGRDDIEVTQETDGVVRMEHPAMPGGGIRVSILEPEGTRFESMGLRLVHENGFMDVLKAETTANRIRVRIEQAK